MRQAPLLKIVKEQMTGINWYNKKRLITRPNLEQSYPYNNKLVTLKLPLFKNIVKITELEAFGYYLPHSTEKAPSQF